MVIKTSTGAEVGRLVTRLTTDTPAGREAALARLAVLGGRAVPALIAAVTNAELPLHARTAALAALETIGDRRALEPACELAMASGIQGELTQAAIGVVRTRVNSPVEAEAARSFDLLTSLVLDPARTDEVRLAALDALREVPGQAVAALTRRLADDPSPALRRRATGQEGSDEDEFQAAVSGRLPESADRLRALVGRQGAATPLGALHRLIGVIRSREADEQGAAREAWLVARGAVHEVLASRRSRVALYDLREALEQAPAPLPLGFLAALKAVGDRSCLEPLAAAYSRWEGPPRAWWRPALALAFRDILRRERLGRRHAVVRKVLAKHPDAGAALMPGLPASRLS
jgi:hypothetical protein